ncbi:uncharacterized protein LOC126335663 [Schistocerca gregaria]|uniref:uncharacterized protein LOC126335663 n=1 Tax=Schistocerca gregaria TaxID=7010 RepID=UPI00211EFB30|nr:uncharacterized protein LOC126335663 [Schistocerca gregaria]
MALRVAGRLRTLRKLVAAVAGLCNPHGSTAHEIVEWNAHHPCGTNRCHHLPINDSESRPSHCILSLYDQPMFWITMRKDKARLLTGLRYGVMKGVLEKHGCRYKLAMEGGRPKGRQQDARPQVRCCRQRRCRSSRRRCRTRAPSSSSHHRRQWKCRSSRRRCRTRAPSSNTRHRRQWKCRSSRRRCSACSRSSTTRNRRQRKGRSTKRRCCACTRSSSKRMSRRSTHRYRHPTTIAVCTKNAGESESHRGRQPGAAPVAPGRVDVASCPVGDAAPSPGACAVREASP